MSRYDSDQFDDRSGSAGGFEDPRFAGGRRPDDDDERAFGGSFGGGANRGGGSRFSCGCLLTVLGLGAAFLILCCGGLGWFGLNERGDRVAAELSRDPNLRGQLAEILGPDYTLSQDLLRTLDVPEGAVYEASGPRGAGELLVVSQPEQDVNPDAGQFAVTILSARLTLEDGTVRELIVAPPEDAPEQRDDAVFDDR